MKPGDLVRLRDDPDNYYDWKTLSTGLSGYYLREPKTMNLLKDRTFTSKDICLVIRVDRITMMLVLTPRGQTGLIHVNKLEVVSETG